MAYHRLAKQTEKSQAQDPGIEKPLCFYSVWAKSLEGSDDISGPHTHCVFPLKISHWGPRLASAS